MIKYFDYIFYRIYLFYKAKGDDNPILMTINFIVVFQLVFIFVTGVLIQKFTSLSFNSIGKNLYWLIVAIVGTGLYSLNAFHFLKKKHYLTLLQLHANNNLNYKIKLWMLFTQPIILIISLIVVLYIASLVK